MPTITQVNVIGAHKALFDIAGTADNPIEKVILTYADGKSSEYHSDPVPVTPLPSQPPPEFDNYWRPDWIESPAQPAITRVRQASPANFKSVWQSRARGDEIQLLRGQVYDLKALIGNKLEIDKNDMRLSAFGDGAPPLLTWGGAYCVLSVSSARVEVVGIDLKSLNPVRQATGGAWISGKDVRLLKMNIHAAGEHCFNIRPSARRVELNQCANTGKVAGYFCYANGGDLSLINCTSDKVGLYGYRANTCGDQYLAGCTFIGSNPTTPSSICMIADVTRAAVVASRFVNTALATGPNMDINGFNQADPDGTDDEKYAALLAKTSEDVDLRDVAFEKGATLTIGYGSVNVRANGVKGDPRIVVKPDGYLPVNGKKYKQPAAKDVTIDGKRWA